MAISKNPRLKSTCPHCSSTNTIKHGVQSGNIRRICKECKKSFTEKSSQLKKLKEVFAAIQRIAVVTPNIPTVYMEWVAKLEEYYKERIKTLEKKLEKED